MHLRNKEEKEIGINKYFLRGGFVDKRRIKETVKRLKMLYSGLSLEDILLERNIVRLYLDNNDLTKGVYTRVNGIQIIFINSNLCDFERRMVLAHELGHAVLHPDVDFSDIKKIDEVTLAKYEFEADTFASEILLDDDLLSKYPNCSVSDIARCEGVCEKFVLIKFHNSVNFYKNFNII